MPFGRMQICAKAKSAAMMTQIKLQNFELFASLRFSNEETPERDIMDVDSSVLSSSWLIETTSLGGEVVSFSGGGYGKAFG